ncbi:alpha-ketoglutarate-dependent dioxygenase AlkB family protein [Stackebrandtia nassauensis]|uniref:2OG-Fe(II) oxygenase n=1 Tax=Stackebrandtia nassauensis (strain DSM 44728 / CIP 108903 / NRRL B-16338 / NBRC 102104 / LLR-40K-21) TaxID=446470 RepID=D3PUE7_STANL|nr:alpha-ketoglutarate-dependent dioxygenase AlkB [Stackebrandtia nassauensis]ADD42960.1 2OG-Fe(II) oxygenase [Stackebrandtia nassauensis DSM 44728]
MALIPQGPRTIAPGAVHVPGWLTRSAQRDLVAACRDWSRPPAGMTRVKTPGGRWMSVRQVCLGLHWTPYRYSRTHTDGSHVKAFPEELARLAVAAVATAYDDPGDYAPDIALINYYDSAARMGMHQDKEEHCDAPVVSLSLGDSCVFRFGNTENRNKPWTDVTLESGDLFVFGGESRFAFHGVPKTMPGTGPSDIDMGAGRLNITIRQSGIES